MQSDIKADTRLPNSLTRSINRIKYVYNYSIMSKPEYSLFNALPKWYYYIAVVLYLTYWPVGVMISLAGSYDSDYANRYQILPGDNMTITTLDNCYEYLQLTVLCDKNAKLQMWSGDNYCVADFENECVLRDFTSGPVTIWSIIDNSFSATRFSIMCNTNFKETFQFYTNLFSIICSILAFALIANCILLTCVHNTVVCVIRTLRKPKNEASEALMRTTASPPRYRKQETYDAI